MLITDIGCILLLLLFCIVWLWRNLGARGPLLWGSASGTLICALIGVFDYRWQAAPCGAVAALLLVLLIVRQMRGIKKKSPVPIVSGALFITMSIFAFVPLYLFPIFDLPEVWYPAESVDGLEPRPYLNKAEARTTAASMGENFGLTSFLFTHLKHVGTNSYEGAQLIANAAGLPVLFFSHGYMSFGGQNTALMEELASHGYLVFSVTHTGDSGSVVFPDGTVIPSDPGLLEAMAGADQPSEAIKKAFAGKTYAERYEGQIQNYRESLARDDRLIMSSGPVWVEDRLFVLDELAAGRVDESVAGIVAAGDFSKVGHMGMSFGGSTTGEVCQRDPRCAGGVNLDGGNYHPSQFNRDQPAPFLMFHSDWVQMFAAFDEEDPDPEYGYNDFSYERHETAGMRNDIYRLRVKESLHLGVSDMVLMARQPVRGLLFGSIDGRTMIAIMNDIVLGFFNKHLRGVENDFPDAQFAAYADDVVPHDASAVRKWWMTTGRDEAAARSEAVSGIDHVIVAVPDLEAAVADFEAQTGLRPYSGGAHPGLGTANYLLPIGHRTYLEIIGPDPTLDAPTGRGAEYISLTAPRLAGFALAESDFEAIASRARDLGVELDAPAAGSRQTPAGQLLTWQALGLPTDPFGDQMVFAIDWGNTIHPADNGPALATLESVRITTPNSEQAILILQRLFDADVFIEKGEKAATAVRLELPTGTLNYYSDRDPEFAGK